MQRALLRHNHLDFAPPPRLPVINALRVKHNVDYLYEHASQRSLVLYGSYVSLALCLRILPLSLLHRANNSTSDGEVNLQLLRNA